jgi:small-conductance mechanosensitive channel
MTRLLRPALRALAACVLAPGLGALADPAPSLAKPAAEPFAVVYRGEELFSLSCSLGSYPLADRAAGILARLDAVAHDPAFDPLKVSTAEVDIGTGVFAGERALMTVTDCDAAAEGTARAALAGRWAEALRGAIEKRRSEYGGFRLKNALLNTVLATAALVLLFWLYRRLRPVFYRRLDVWESRFAITRLKFYTTVRRALLLFGRVAFVWLFILAVFGWLLLVLGELPWTAGSARTIVSWAVKPLSRAGNALVGYLPNIFSLVVIALLAWAVIRLLRLFFDEVGGGNVPIAGFDREWAPSTYKIVRFLVLAFALVAAFPYIPGSSSEAFKGISLVLGVLVSFASSSAISNVFAGLTLTYTNAFHVGDWVRIGEAYGDVTETTLLVTRIRTIKNVAITIPNSSVLSSQVQNFTRALSQGGLRLHTSVTIGYDAPWRKVHELLIAAARGTKGVLAAPAPFVLQRSLDDFFVTYEINAYIDDPPRTVDILSDLHEAIQDRFNEGGVEIMSPHYASVRDGNAVTIPPEKRPPGYEAPPFRVALDARNPGETPRS